MVRAKRTRVGQRRTRVILCKQSPSATANTDGERPEVETEIDKRWAEVKPLRGQERFLASQTQADITYRVRLPYDNVTKDLTPRNWLKIKQTDQRLNIVRAYDLDGRHHTIELECKERV